VPGPSPPACCNNSELLRFCPTTLVPCCGLFFNDCKVVVCHMELVAMTLAQGEAEREIWQQRSGHPAATFINVQGTRNLKSVCMCSSDGFIGPFFSVFHLGGNRRAWCLLVNNTLAVGHFPAVWERAAHALTGLFHTPTFPFCLVEAGRSSPCSHFKYSEVAGTCYDPSLHALGPSYPQLHRTLNLGRTRGRVR